MKKRVTIVQMAVELGAPEENYKHALALLEKAMKDNPDIIVLPETWNVGFFPKDNLKELADKDGARTKAFLSEFAKAHDVNIVGGSVAVLREGKVYNTTYIVDRSGAVISEYDKVHGFSPSGEHEFFQGGTRTHAFKLDGIPCSSVICYDLRFPELFRTETIKGVDLFFVPAEWPDIRVNHWVTLNTARAIENQMYLCAVNGCGTAGDTKYGGNSLLISPGGDELVHCGGSEEIQIHEIDLDIIKNIRESINVFRDRKPECYKL